jgi:hypothetical protein
VVEALCCKPEGRGFKIRWGVLIFSIYLIFPAPEFTQPLTEISTRSRKIIFWVIERRRCVEMAILPPSVTRLSRQCRVLNISQFYRPPRPVTGIYFTLLSNKEITWHRIGWNNDCKWWLLEEVDRGLFQEINMEFVETGYLRRTFIIIG